MNLKIFYILFEVFFLVMKLLLKGHGVQIPFPEIPGVKLRIVFFDTDEGRKQPRTNIIVLFGYTVGRISLVIFGFVLLRDFNNIWYFLIC